MRIIARPKIISFYERFADSKSSLESWYHEAKHSNWKSPDDVKKMYRNASIVGNNRVIFNICGNKYRLVVKIEYELSIIFIRFIGTHKEYDKIKVEEI
jgi:mRNA interferase HigB